MTKNITAKEISSLPTEGSRAIASFAALCERIGYKGNQLTLNNGSHVTSITDFLEDNPGCVEVIFDWITDNYTDEDEDI